MTDRQGALGFIPTSGSAAVHETHVSWLFLVGDRAYKLKKPVTLDFLDLSSQSERERQCHREVDLNRRLAPDVYLGVAEIRGVDDSVCDHMVVMRRMPDDRRLSTLIRDGADLSRPIREIARTVAAFHARAATSPTIAMAGSIETIRRHWEDNFATMEPFVGSILDPTIAGRVQTLASRYLDGRTQLFEYRIAAGAVRDGHGDILADDIFCLADGPRILDCLEFNDELRFGDVVADIGFLAMDLERVGAPDLAEMLMHDYREFSGQTYPSSLVHHYIAYRAHVRAKVACLRAAQATAPESPGEAQRLLALALAHLEQGRSRLAIVGGLPGTGKSTLAAGISDRLGWTVLRSDEVRKDLAGLGHTVHATSGFGSGIYDPDSTAQTYETLFQRARSLLQRGESVVLDASWNERRMRDAAQTIAEQSASDFIELRCEIPPEVAALRMRQRTAEGVDPSDADPAVARRLSTLADPWPTATTVDTAPAPSLAVDDALRECLTRP